MSFYFTDNSFFVIAKVAWEDKKYVVAVILVIVGIFLFFKISVPLGTSTWNFFEVCLID